jgi:hypothetical protein
VTARFRHRDLAWGGSCILSAEGAVFNASLGQRPRIQFKIKSVALQARFLPNISVGLSTNQRVELRFQRWRPFRLESWGDAPGLYEDAFLALDPNSDGSLDSSDVIDS